MTTRRNTGIVEPGVVRRRLAEFVSMMRRSGDDRYFLPSPTRPRPGAQIFDDTNAEAISMRVKLN